MQERVDFAMGRCSLGQILIAASEKGILAVLIGDAPEELQAELQTRFPGTMLARGSARAESQLASVIGFIDRGESASQLSLDVRGSPFQQRVWQALQEIPSGTVLTYTDLARRVGMPGATRAVASACAANPLAVVIPCHRVVGKNGRLAGYRWGLERKRTLLAREAAAMQPAR